MIVAVAHRQFLELAPRALMQKIVRRGCFIDVRSAFDAEAFRREGVRVWRL
jgi:UDP-N-acetyl-D-galactosamine dehydrogenase